jgi:hypothetical protein
MSAIMYDVKAKACKDKLNIYVKPLYINEFLLKKFNIPVEEVKNGTPIAEMLGKLDEFITKNVPKGSTFSLVVMHLPIMRNIRQECKRKSIKMKPYFDKYVDLKNMFLYLYNSRRQLLNLQCIKQLLLKYSVESCIDSSLRMCKLLNLKYQERLINGLDKANNLVSVIQKLMEKGIEFSTSLIIPVDLNTLVPMEDKLDASTRELEEEKKEANEFELI